MSSDAEQTRDLTLTEALEIAIRAHQNGQLETAAKIYKQVLEVWPDSPDALHFSGLLAFMKGDSEEAVRLVEKSLALAPEHPDFWNNFGNVLKSRGKKEDATSAYLRAIELRTDFADAHSNLGVMASQRGDYTSAVESFQKAISFQPKHADAHLNLGSAFEKLEMLPEAAAAYSKAIELKPTVADTYGRLGHVFWQQGKLEEAVAAIVRYTDMNTKDPKAFIVLGGLFFDQGRIDESIEAYRKAVELGPTDNYANRVLGLTLAKFGRAEEARDVWKRWSDAAPDDPVPRHLYRAGLDDHVPARAEDDFVVREFNRFADSFDTKLKNLEYRAPEIVADALRSVVPDGAANLDILDAGCGTGLCAPLLRPFARRLEGVDLSPGMLEKAKTRGGYDELFRGELTAFIGSKQDAYDVIISADTLCYFGQLETVFSAVAAALHRGGYFIFTLERTAESTGAAKLTLDLSGRYTHTELYVRTAIAQANLTVMQLSVSTLRLEYFKPVEGMVVVARKPVQSPG